jgi:hypothetical protein
MARHSVATHRMAWHGILGRRRAGLRHLTRLRPTTRGTLDNANWRKFIDTGYNRFLDFGGYNRKTHCAHSGYNRWL